MVGMATIVELQTGKEYYNYEMPIDRDGMVNPLCRDNFIDQRGDFTDSSSY